MKYLRFYRIHLNWCGAPITFRNSFHSYRIQLSKTNKNELQWIFLYKTTTKCNSSMCVKICNIWSDLFKTRQPLVDHGEIQRITVKPTYKHTNWLLYAQLCTAYTAYNTSLTALYTTISEPMWNCHYFNTFIIQTVHRTDVHECSQCRV